MSHPLPSDLLLAHAGALRTMARALLHDEHAADDVVQETWLRALIAPPDPDGGVGGWLRSVAQGFALQHRRAEGRRARREQLYAAERCEAFDADQRSAVLRSVMEAVLALDEPYRETVLLRWFEGLPPRAIAARLGVQVATVDSRLQRAHTRLRARLERDLGREPRGWRGLVALALGTPERAPTASTLFIPLIGVAVSLKVVGAALAAVVGVCLWVGWDRLQPANVEPAGIAAATAPSDERPPLTGATVDGERKSVSSTAPAPAPEETPPAERSAVLPAGPYTFALEVVVVDSAERPVHGAEIYLGPASCSSVRLGGTGWDGLLVREWRGFEPTFQGVLHVRVDGRETSLRRVVLTTGTRHALRFQADRPLGALQLRVAMGADGRKNVGFRLDEVRLSGRALLRADQFELDAAGNGVFLDSSLVHLVRPPPTDASEIRFQESARFGAVAVEVAVGRSLTSGQDPPADPPAAPSDRATVRGVVHDDNGRPLTHLVVAGRTPDRWNTGVVCDAEGGFVFADVPPGPMEVCVGGGDRIFVREVIELAPGETRFLELRPVMRSNLKVRLQDAQSKPLSEWRVEARGAGPDAPLLGMAVTDEQGATVLGLVGEGPLQLFARPEAQSGAPAILVGHCTSARTEELRLELPNEMRHGSITFTVQDPLSDQAAARAWRLDSGEGLMLRSAGEREGALGGAGPSTDVAALTTGGVLPGRWRVELRAPGRAWSEVGEFDLAPGQKLDLGRVMLPAHASVKLASASAEPTLQLSLRTQVDGALVVWPECLVALPVTFETLPDVALEILRRPAGAEDRPATLPLSDPLRPRAGREHVVELPGAR